MEPEFDEQDIEGFISGCVKKLCIRCGQPVAPNPSGRPRKFCSDLCRQRFWKAHPESEKWDSFERLVCPVCGREFYAQKENTRKRKYCSRACANRGRSKRWRRQTDDG